ncbi:MAG: alpha-1,2-fucosyltransferase [Patescibacteria group bacterium]
MIIVKLSGGLGNQFFQYAHGKACALKNNTELALDTSWYAGRTDRTYMLNHFNINATIAKSIDILRIKIFSPKNYLRGDYQSEKYFENIEDTIHKEYSLKEALGEDGQELLTTIASSNAVSIHFRGNDYISGPKASFHGVCPQEYYTEAIDLISNRITSPHFYVFTDDIEWAKKYITLPTPHTIVSDKRIPTHEELILMASCQHNIIANSTFSWWAGWLNKNPQKMVIAPKKWFNHNTVDTTDLIPSQWILL